MLNNEQISTHFQFSQQINQWMKDASYVFLYQCIYTYIYIYIPFHYLYCSLYMIMLFQINKFLRKNPCWK